MSFIPYKPMTAEDWANMDPEVKEARLAKAKANGFGAGWTDEMREKARHTREVKKNFHRLARFMMEAPIFDEEELIDELKAHGFEDADYQTAVFWKQLKKAFQNSDTEAAKFVRDTAGYKPTETMQVGNLDDRPFEQIDLSKLSTEQLREMIAARQPLNEVTE